MCRQAGCGSRRYARGDEVGMQVVILCCAGPGTYTGFEDGMYVVGSQVVKVVVGKHVVQAVQAS